MIVEINKSILFVKRGIRNKLLKKQRPVDKTKKWIGFIFNKNITYPKGIFNDQAMYDLCKAIQLTPIELLDLLTTEALKNRSPVALRYTDAIEFMPSFSFKAVFKYIQTDKNKSKKE